MDVEGDKHSVEMPSDDFDEAVTVGFNLSEAMISIVRLI